MGCGVKISVSDWGGGMPACCTMGPVVQSSLVVFIELKRISTDLPQWISAFICDC